MKELVGSDFQNDKPYNLNSKKCAFVLFYADWCGHCQSFKPEYQKFARKAVFIDVFLVNVDTNKQLLSNIEQSNSPFKISGFPTIWMYKHGNLVGEYSGNRTVKDLLQTAMSLCHE
jgi:thiol-disulfide isomerase/thioredoxin